MTADHQLVLFTDSPDDPQFRMLLAQVEWAAKKPITILPLAQLTLKANVKAVLPTLVHILPN